MKISKMVLVLACLIALLALVAAGTGVLSQGGEGPREVTSVHGTAVTLYGRGLYRYDPVSTAAQMIGQDVVTLVVGIPLLVVSLLLYRRRSARGQLLLTGTLGYFLYTYMSMCFGAAFNPLFLAYVTLFSMSLFAFIICMLSIDLQALPLLFGNRLPRRGIAVFLFCSAAFLLLNWLGLVVPPSLAGAVPAGLDTNTSMFIQVLDLGLLVPLMLVAGVALLQRRPLGYLLASVGLIKFMTMGLALIAMIIGQALAGVPVPAGLAAGFTILALAAVAMAVVMLHAVRELPQPRPEAGVRLPGMA